MSHLLLYLLTVTETLQYVQEIQTEVAQLATSLAQLNQTVVSDFTTLFNDIQTLECQSAATYVQTYVMEINNQYQSYCGIDMITNQVVTTPSTVTIAMQNFIKLHQNGADPKTDLNMINDQTNINNWLNGVLSAEAGSATLFTNLQDLSDALTQTSTSGTLKTTPLQTCAQSIFNNWQVNYPDKSPYDDRQYYEIIYNWYGTYLGVQLQALQMLQAANLYQ